MIAVVVVDKFAGAIGNIDMHGLEVFLHLGQLLVLGLELGHGRIDGLAHKALVELLDALHALFLPIINGLQAVL